VHRWRTNRGCRSLARGRPRWHCNRWPFNWPPKEKCSCPDEPSALTPLPIVGPGRCRKDARSPSSPLCRTNPCIRLSCGFGSADCPTERGDRPPFVRSPTSWNQRKRRLVERDLVLAKWVTRKPSANFRNNLTTLSGSVLPRKTEISYHPQDSAGALRTSPCTMGSEGVAPRSSDQEAR
jgi:hypothetical protein